MAVDASFVPAAIADYRIIEPLGEGSNGRFYLAEAPARLGLTTDRVALKVFNAEVSKDAYRRGVRELRAFAAVRSPRLVKIYDAALDDRFFYAMEYFPLGSIASPSRELERSEILRALQDAALATHELHEHGLAHGDIKPANVMLHADGGKLSDLGVARLLTSTTTVTSVGPSTSIEFLDPDLLEGESPSRATDIWALGATIHRTLSGEGLYGELQSAQPIVAFRAVISRRGQVSDKLSKAEADLVHASIAPKENRLPTAAAVAERLAALR